MAYATIADIQNRIPRTLSSEEASLCDALIEDAAVLVDSVKADADANIKRVVTCRMVVRALGDGQDAGIPLGASQGSVSALGYSQSWTIGSGGGAGELYIGKTEKKLLGASNAIGSRSPVEDLVPEVVV